MTENFRSTLGIVRDTDGPALLCGVADGYAPASLVTVQRRIRTSATRRTPHRAVAAAKMTCSSYTVRHDWDLCSDLTNLKRAIEGMADSGRGEAITGGWRWRIGRGLAPPVRWHTILQHVDGSHYEGRRCLLTDFTITAERRSAVKCETTFTAQELTTVNSAPSLAAVPGAGRGVGPGSIAYDFDGDSTGGLFGLVLGFQREAEAAGFDEANVASAFAGRLVPDIAGRMVCRAGLAAFDDAFRGEMTGSLLFTFAIPQATTLSISMPNCILKAAGRTHIDANLYEMVLDWAAIQEGSSDLAVIELTS